MGDEGLALHATIGRLGITAVHDLHQFLREGRDEVELTIAAFERLDDRLGLAKAWHLLAYLDWTRGRLTQAEAAAERARALARRRDPGWEANAIGMHCLTLYWGPLPAERVERRCREALAEAEQSGVASLAATAYRVLARVATHQGDLEEARRCVDAATAISREEGSLLPTAVDCISRAMVEVLAGDLAAAEETLHAGYRQLEEMGGTGPQVNVATMLAQVRLLQGRIDEAEELTRILRAAGRPRAGRRPGQVALHPGHRHGPPGELQRPSGWPGRPSTWPDGPTSSIRGPRPTSTWPRCCCSAAGAARPPTSWTAPSPCSRRRATRSASAAPAVCWPAPAAEPQAEDSLGYSSSQLCSDSPPSTAMFWPVM